MGLNSWRIISCNSVSVAGLTDVFAFEDVNEHHEGSFDEVCFVGAVASFF